MEYKRIYLNLMKIPKGKVSTYKELSKITEIHPRVIGRILASNENLEEFPCYKIIKSDGKIGGYVLGVEKKRELLEKEGIEIINNKIDLKKYLFRFQ